MTCAGLSRFWCVVSPPQCNVSCAITEVFYESGEVIVLLFERPVIFALVRGKL